MKQKVYCKGCKYCKSGILQVYKYECIHPKNSVVHHAYAPVIVHFSVEYENRDNDCKLREENK